MQKGFTNEIIDLALESLAFEKGRRTRTTSVKQGRRTFMAMLISDLIFF